MKTAIITGATGLVGFALLKELAKNNVRTYVLCRPNSKRRLRFDGLEGITIIEADLENADRLRDMPECDVFFHLAWEGERNHFIEQYKNIGVALSCLKLAVKLRCKSFICRGSQSEYGDATELITEDTKPNPTTAYGACKIAAYYLTKDLAYRLKIEHIWVRIFNVYGPNDTPKTLIFSLIKSLKETGRSALTTNGCHIWNYLYADDAARALFKLGKANLASGIYNLASKECKPLKDFVEEVKQIVAPKANVLYGNEQSAVNLNVSTEKIRLAIGEFEEMTFTEGIKYSSTQ
jgi:nucleoside-diphosphate-sugar epimerase